MAELLAVSCPECKKDVKVPTRLVGKKIKCKGCGHIFLVKGKSQAAKGKAAAPAATGPEDEEDSSNPYGLTETSLANRCPACASELQETDRLCLKCGYDLVTREVHKTVKTIS